MVRRGASYPFSLIAVVLGAAVTLFLALFTLSEEAKAGGESYECVWENGKTQTLSYAAAYEYMTAASEEGITVAQNGQSGFIVLSEAYTAVYGTLESAPLADLLNVTADGLSSLERAAVWRAFSSTIWYDGETFSWNGEKISLTDDAECETLVLLSGGFSSGFLAESGAVTLDLRAEGEISSSDFISSNVSQIAAETPYNYHGGALYLETAGVKRLVASLPGITELSVDEDVDFYDEGALTACESLQSLTIPFCGSAGQTDGSSYSPYFLYLFSEAENIPESLKSVTVTGGVIESYAFYGCNYIEEIDASLVNGDDIAKNAFSGLASLQKLLSPVPVSLNGFALSMINGCYLYEREANSR